MKKHYERDMEDFLDIKWLNYIYKNPHKYRYNHRYSFMWRLPRIMSEVRQLHRAVQDGIRVRPSRLAGFPETWDDRNIARNYGKSWKDFTKRRHQWETR